CISQTGRQPAMHSPTAVPRIPASARGVSTHRSAPKRSCSPAVARKTPPSFPTSSPMTSTLESRSISVCRASLMASTSSRSGIAEHPPHLLQLLRLRGRRLGIGVLEDEPGIGRRLRLRLGDPAPHELECLLLDLPSSRVGQDSRPRQVALVAAEAFVF